MKPYQGIVANHKGRLERRVGARYTLSMDGMVFLKNPVHFDMRGIMSNRRGVTALFSYNKSLNLSLVIEGTDDPSSAARSDAPGNSAASLVARSSSSSIDDNIDLQTRDEPFRDDLRRNF